MAKKRYHSFSGRLTRNIMLVELVIMGIISGLLFFWMTSAMSTMTHEHYLKAIAFTNEKMESMVLSVEVAAMNNLDEVQSHLENPDDVYGALEKELLLNPHVLGCFAAFVPNYYPEIGRWFEPYVVHREGGRIEHMQVGSANHNYVKTEWFVNALAGEEGYWSDPYFDNDGAHAMLCSYSLPLHDQEGRTIGVYGIDLPLDWLMELQRERDRKEASSFTVIDSTSRKYAPYSFILGRNGEYVVHPDEERVLNDNYFAHSKLTPDTLDDYVGELMLAGQEGSATFVIDGVKSRIYYSQLPRTGWSMAIVVPTFTINFPGIVVGSMMLLLMGLGLLAIAVMCHLGVRRATRPLYKLVASADEVAKGNFNTPLPYIKHHDEIRQLRDSFGQMQESLGKYMDQLKMSTAQKASLESELNIARDIQRGMLPKTFPPFPERTDIDLYGSLKPAKAVGGDFYDFNIRDEKLFFCIGDVSGKGIPASLVMAVLGTQFRALSAREDNPERIMTTLNVDLVAHNELNMFATMFIGMLDLATGELLYCNAGHDAPLLVGNDTPSTPLPCDSNLPIGAIDEWSYSLQRTTLQPGMTLFLYTDGVTEAEDVTHAQFGRQRMCEVAAANVPKEGPEDLKQLVDAMIAAVHEFVGEAEQSDDLTMLSVQYKG